MAGARAAIRYAKAVLSLAVDNKTDEVVNKDMKLIAKTIAESSDLKEALLSPVITSSVKKTILLSVFSKTAKETTSLINTLVENNRVSILENIAVKYTQLFEAAKGIEVATVTTAIALDSKFEAQVIAKAKALTGKEIEVKNIIDKTIIGGFILRVGDKQYDASVANKLDKLKREFSIN
ncbi:MAG: ATP synthase F1 subunit delta [Aestuariibaculum sp.]